MSRALQSPHEFHCVLKEPQTPEDASPDQLIPGTYIEIDGVRQTVQADGSLLLTAVPRAERR